MTDYLHRVRVTLKNNLTCLRNIYGLITMYQAMFYMLGYGNEQNGETPLTHGISIQLSKEKNKGNLNRNIQWGDCEKKNNNFCQHLVLELFKIRIDLQN